MLLFWLGVALLVAAPVVVGLTLAAFHLHVRRKYLPILFDNFQNKPLFFIPRGKPWQGAEDVSFPAEDGRTLRGCYVRTPARRRRGVIAFGLEYGSDRWSCRPYVEHLVEAGYDVFAFEPRGQGESDKIPGYEPLQWVTDYEVADAKAAVAYLKGRPDADPGGVGWFGISKGAGAGAAAMADDPYVRCLATDGMFGFETSMLPQMRVFFRVYNTDFPLETIPDWYLAAMCRVSMRRIEKARHCHFASVERGMRGLAPRPVLMIHGERDAYIKPSAAKALYELAGGPRELWVVPGAKHNQAVDVASDEYRARVLAFFDRYLGDLPTAGSGSAPSPEPARTEAVSSGPGGR